MVTERDVKLRKVLTGPFGPGTTLEVIGRSRNTILVEYFDGREYRTARFEVCADDQEETET